jgi:hypothetical protein
VSRLARLVVWFLLAELAARLLLRRSRRWRRRVAEGLAERALDSVYPS